MCLHVLTKLCECRLMSTFVVESVLFVLDTWVHLELVHCVIHMYVHSLLVLCMHLVNGLWLPFEYNVCVLYVCVC